MKSVTVLMGALALTVASTSALADDLVSAVLPLSRSPTLGQPATAFATVINISGRALTGCTASLPGLIGTFNFQTTDAATNEEVGGVNQAFSLTVGASQSMTFAIQSTRTLASSDQHIVFQCSDSAAASSIVGVNTLRLSVNATPTPDMVALAATSTNDGTLHIPGTNGTGAFAMATANVGTAGDITVSADTGDIALPLEISTCQTNPATGQCLAPPQPTVTTNVPQNGTPTFSFFVKATAPIPFSPASVRLFVRLKDAGGVTRGSTSVALSTDTTGPANPTPGGYYAGISRSTPMADTPVPAPFLISEDGEFRGITYDPFTKTFSELVAHVAPNAQLNFATIGTLIAPGGNMLPDRTQAYPLTLNGALSPRSFIAAAYSAAGQSVAFSATYQKGRYERPSSLEMLSGTWNFGDVRGGGILGISISKAGVITFAAPPDCTGSGTVSLIDPRYNAYRISLTLPSCMTKAGTYTGLGTLYDGITANDSLEIYLSNESGVAVLGSLTRY